jgi:hypothetical protein
MEEYVNDRRKPGHFLCAVIQNDLAQAVGRADEHSIKVLRDIVGWFFNKAPAACWGSKERMDAWLDTARDENGAVLCEGDICYHHSLECKVRVLCCLADSWSGQIKVVKVPGDHKPFWCHPHKIEKTNTEI